MYYSLTHFVSHETESFLERGSDSSKVTPQVPGKAERGVLGSLCFFLLFCFVFFCWTKDSSRGQKQRNVSGRLLGFCVFMCVGMWVCTASHQPPWVVVASGERVKCMQFGVHRLGLPFLAVSLVLTLATICCVKTVFSGLSFEVALLWQVIVADLIN